jgi:thioredoxin-related protein
MNKMEIIGMLKKTLLVILTLWFFVPVYAAGDITWLHNIDQAFEAAKADGKMIMVDVYTEWCTWCGKLDDEVYTDKDVIALADEMVKLKVNAEDGGEGQAFSERLGVGGYPTILFLKADGREIDRIGGFLPAPQFREEMKRIKEGRGTFLSLQEAEAAGTISNSDRLLLAEQYLMRSQMQEAEGPARSFLDNYGETMDENTDRAYTILAQVKMSSFDFEEADSYLLKVHDQRPDSHEMPRVLLMLVYSKAMQNDEQGARKYAGELKSRFPNERQAIGMVDRILAQF